MRLTNRGVLFVCSLAFAATTLLGDRLIGWW